MTDLEYLNILQLQSSEKKEQDGIEYKPNTMNPFKAQGQIDNLFISI